MSKTHYKTVQEVIRKCRIRYPDASKKALGRIIRLEHPEINYKTLGRHLTKTFAYPENAEKPSVIVGEVSKEEVERFWRGYVEIKRQYASGSFSLSFNNAHLLWLSLRSPYKERLAGSFNIVIKELEDLSQKEADFFIRGTKRQKFLKKVMPLLQEKLAEIGYKMEKQS